MSKLVLEKKSINTGKGIIFYYLNSSFSHRPTIVLLHGLSANHSTWLKTAEALFENSYNCLVLDLRGHGLSDKRITKSNYQMSVFSNDLNMILSEEKISNYFLAGYSFGGVIALDYMFSNNNLPQGLVLISTNHANPFEFRGLRPLSFLLFSFANIFAFFLSWQKRKEFYFYKPDTSQGYWRSVWLGLKTMPFSINLWMLCQMYLIDYKKNISSINIPTLMLYSKGDPFVTEREIRYMAKLIPTAEVVVSANQSHFVASQSQPEVTDILLRFLKKHENSNF